MKNIIVTAMFVAGAYYLGVSNKDDTVTDDKIIKETCIDIMGVETHDAKRCIENNTEYFVTGDKNHHEIIQIPADYVEVNPLLEEDDELINKPIKKPIKQQVIKNTKKITHKIRKGETLYSIARQYKKNPKELMKINNCGKCNTFKTGDVVTLY